ncbi:MULTISPECIES: BamA/TamA family outer membrane protein [Ignavibacterium]|jgi:outer membrane protein insertion porin family|uniref:BamA/OMP85 family outer membrane protein n=1 Tax=Ignavibacterium TaxID=795750 RepID=UPI0025BAEDEB|nr:MULTISPECIES: BamA/TamA family outer membrane protein [Ignavibacterium]MBI5660523.1 BamA/TamA family outer membrane protein [Ignavibacterium album]
MIFFRTTIILSFFILTVVSFAQRSSTFELIEIRFEGNNSFSKADLLAQIESKESPFWLWKFLYSFTPLGSEKQYFDSLKIPLDKQAIINFYLANGFFQAKVTHEVLFDTSAQSAILIYKIQEGRAAVFGEIKIFGLDKLPPDEKTQLVINSITIEPQKRYVQSEVQSNINSMLQFLANNGYLFAQYDSTVVLKDSITLAANVNIYLQSGDKYYIDGMKIYKSGVGADEITDELIKEIVNIPSGENYDQSRLERSEIRLLRTGLFNSVAINPVIKDTFNYHVPIEVTTQIGTLNEISPEVKGDNEFSSFNTGLGIDFIRKNLFGDARKLTLSTSFRLIDILNFNFSNLFKSSENRDSTYQGVLDTELRLEQPYLFGKPILTTTKAYYRASTFLRETERIYGASQAFDFEMPVYTFITLLKPQFSLEVADYETRDNQSVTSFKAKSITPAFGVETGSYKTDNFLFPTSGYNLYLYPEIFQSETDAKLVTNDAQAEVKETGRFWKIQTSFSFFQNISRDRKGILGIKFKSGYIQSLSGSYDLIPPNKTFFAGGSNSLRGWRSREILPKDTVEYFGIRTRGDNTPRGGTFLIEGSIEFRRKFAESLGLALFADYGNVWNGYEKIVLNQFAVAAGMGVRYYSSIAPFRLDFGFKLYNPDDQKTIFQKNFLKNLEFHFGIGEAF